MIYEAVSGETASFFVHLAGWNYCRSIRINVMMNTVPGFSVRMNLPKNCREIWKLRNNIKFVVVEKSTLTLINLN